MYNWSTQTDELKKDKNKYTTWKLEQMVNFGLDGQKLNRRDLEKYWDQIQIDPSRRKLLAVLLGK